MQIQELIIPGRQPGEKYCLLIDNVFSEDECKELIDLSESKHFEPASLVTNSETNERMKNPNRSNDRVSMLDDEIACKLYNRLLLYLPSKWIYENEVWVPHKCNNRMSVLRYDVNQHYAPHVDVEYVTPVGKLRSFITIQLYLNNGCQSQYGFKGGATRFIQEVGYTRIDERQFLDVIPKSGSVLLFEHELLHTGCNVESGRKYTIRTDIMFKRKK